MKRMEGGKIEFNFKATI